MPCSPLLQGIDDPKAVLRILTDHPILCFSEPSTTFYPLAELGWVEYKVGHWAITSAGRDALEQKKEPVSLADFFGLA